MRNLNTTRATKTLQYVVSISLASPLNVFFSPVILVNIEIADAQKIMV